MRNAGISLTFHQQKLLTGEGLTFDPGGGASAFKTSPSGDVPIPEIPWLEECMPGTGMILVSGMDDIYVIGIVSSDMIQPGFVDSGKSYIIQPPCIAGCSIIVISLIDPLLGSLLHLSSYIIPVMVIIHVSGVPGFTEPFDPG